VEAGGEDSGVVANQHVARPQILRELGEGPVVQRARRAIDDEEARLIAAGGRMLRDELWRQRVVEERGGERRQVVGPGRGRSAALEPTIGIEPMTHALRKRCSTS
jgi:hypothetical protein